MLSLFSCICYGMMQSSCNHPCKFSQFQIFKMAVVSHFFFSCLSIFIPSVHIGRFILHVRDHESLVFFFAEEEGPCAIRTLAFSVREKYLILYSIPSQWLDFFRHRGCWSIFGPYFSSLLATFNAVKVKACASYRWVILVHHIVTFFC